MHHFPKVFTPNHPLVQHNMAIIRDKNTSRDSFLSAFNRLASILLLTAFDELPTKTVAVETPITTCECEKLDLSDPIIVAPILRAGIGLTQESIRLLPEAHICTIGMYRDETTHRPIWYYDKTPATLPENAKVFILDPMLATGHSALGALDLFVSKGIKEENITFVSVLSAPEGLQTIWEKYPEMRVITGAIDDCLNENAYIVPGLGDAGDRLFNSQLPEK